MSLEDSTWLTFPNATPDALICKSVFVTVAAAGNARDGIGILREATDRAVADGAAEIDDTYIEQSIPKAKRALRQEDLQNIGETHRSSTQSCRTGQGSRHERSTRRIATRLRNRRASAP
jgi:Cdc6-like AAA superfamily ATPase